MNQLTLWILTFIMTVLMIVTAIFIARQRAVMPTTPATVVVPSYISVAEPALVVPETTKTIPKITKAVKPDPVIKPELQPAMEKPSVMAEVKVDLSDIKGSLKFSSPDIQIVEGQIPRYPMESTCYRKNVSPAVNWLDAPSNTKSFLLVLERRAIDENATWPWIMFNIPASSTGMPGKLKIENITAEQGVFGTNPYGNQEYTGPCEPKGAISYVLRLFALDIDLPLQPGAGMGDIMPLIDGHVIDAAEIKTEHRRM